MPDAIDDYKEKIRQLESRIASLENENLENRKAKEELEASEKKYRTIFENTGTATILIDDDKIISMINSEFERLSGYSKKETEGKRIWTDFIYPDDLEMMMQYHARRRKSPDKTPKHYRCRVITPSGEIKTAMMTVDLIRGTRQSVASVRDITEQVMLQKTILDISERERRQIGQYLHDDLGQHLVGIEALATLLAQRLVQDGSNEQDLAGEISGLIGDAIKKTRDLSKGLCPVDMDAKGLETALNELKGSVEKIFSIDFILVYDQKIKIENNSTATNLFHIIQEAVNNALRHGKADKITICLETDQKNVIVTIVDNGIGFSDNRNSDGIGLMIMSFRASSINAGFEINSTPGVGTKIECRIKQKYL